MAKQIPHDVVIREGGYSFHDLLDASVPACCSEGCMTEPDGHCEHGFPSVLIEMKVI